WPKGRGSPDRRGHPPGTPGRLSAETRKGWASVLLLGGVIPGFQESQVLVQILEELPGLFGRGRIEPELIFPQQPPQHPDFLPGEFDRPGCHPAFHDLTPRDPDGGFDLLAEGSAPWPRRQDPQAQGPADLPVGAGNAQSLQKFLVIFGPLARAPAREVSAV